LRIGQKNFPDSKGVKMAFDLDWNGIQIDSEARTIVLNGNSYPFEQIRGTQLHSVQKNCMGQEGGGTIEIKTRDLKNPVYKFKSYSVFAKERENYERISILLDLSSY
jgi:hypothetical protein